MSNDSNNAIRNARIIRTQADKSLKLAIELEEDVGTKTILLGMRSILQITAPTFEIVAENQLLLKDIQASLNKSDSSK